MAITTTDTGLLRLLQLSSVSLPVGGYAFSQGLEYAIEAGWVDSVDSAEAWLELQMHDALARVDLPILLRAYKTCTAQSESQEPQRELQEPQRDLQEPQRGLDKLQSESLQHWNQLALACRETRELRLTDTAMGEALMRLLPNLGIQLELSDNGAGGPEDISFVVAFAGAAHAWQVELESAMLGYAWSWLENQVAAATKLIPLGQTQSQQLLGKLQQHVPETIACAQSLEDDDLGASLPALAISSMLHETQYTRLFRS